MITQIIINSLIAGAMYALIASGFSLVYSTAKFMNFAIGAIVAVGAYFLYTFFSILNINFFLACTFTLIASVFVGLFINRVFYESLQNKNASNIVLFIVSITVLILFENIIQIIFSANVRTIKYLEVGTGKELFGAAITHLQLIIIASAVLLFALLFILMKKTKLGLIFRAVSDNKDLAKINGIDYQKILYCSFAISSFLAGIAGILIGLEQNLWPSMSSFLIIKGFAGAIIGGVNSIVGSIVGSFLLGFAENLGTWFLPAAYKDAIAFVILFVFLLFKPQGIFGQISDVK